MFVESKKWDKILIILEFQQIANFSLSDSLTWPQKEEERFQKAISFDIAV